MNKSGALYADLAGPQVDRVPSASTARCCGCQLVSSECRACQQLEQGLLMALSSASFGLRAARACDCAEMQPVWAAWHS